MTDELRKCIGNICKNFNFPDVLDIREPIMSYSVHDLYVVFLNTSTSFIIQKTELLKNGIRSKKEYRQLRRLIKMRLRVALLDLKHLAEEGLLNLGDYYP